MGYLLYYSYGRYPTIPSDLYVVTVGWRACHVRRLTAKWLHLDPCLAWRQQIRPRIKRSLSLLASFLTLILYFSSRQIIAFYVSEKIAKGEMSRGLFVNWWMPREEKRPKKNRLCIQTKRKIIKRTLGKAETADTRKKQVSQESKFFFGLWNSFEDFCC